MIGYLKVLGKVFRIAGNVVFIYVVVFWSGYLYGLQMIPEFDAGIPVDVLAVSAFLLGAAMYLLSGVLWLVCRFISRRRLKKYLLEDVHGSQSPADGQ